MEEKIIKKIKTHLVTGAEYISHKYVSDGGGNKINRYKRIRVTYLYKGKKQTFNISCHLSGHESR